MDIKNYRAAICNILPILYSRQHYLDVLWELSKFEYSLLIYISCHDYHGKMKSIWWPYLRNKAML